MQLELRFDAVLPFALHHFFDPYFAQTVPLPPQPRLAEPFKSFFDEDAAAEPARPFHRFR